MECTLEKTLDLFQGINGDEDPLKNGMEKLAKQFLFGGYFLVNDKRIYLRDIEFYYHEEGKNAKIKDYAMYHITDKLKEDKKDEYYTPGSLNAHVSGVDFTFENPQMKYRASILIRGIRMVSNDGKGTVLGDENRPTYVYEHLLMGKSVFGCGLHIRWMDEERPIEPIQYGFRQNVCKYDDQGNKKAYPGDDQKQPKEILIKLRGEKYCQCDRMWRFGFNLPGKSHPQELP